MDTIAIEWFAEVEEGCAWFSRALTTGHQPDRPPPLAGSRRSMVGSPGVSPAASPDPAEGSLATGAPEVVQVLGGACEVESIATGPDGTILIRGRAVEWLHDGAIDDVTPSDGWPRHVAFSVDGEPLLLVADTPDATEPFVARTLAWVDGDWVEQESSTEDVGSVRALTGGPRWQGRAEGASVDRWALERAPGFALLPRTSCRSRSGSGSTGRSCGAPSPSGRARSR